MSPSHFIALGATALIVILAVKAATPAAAVKGKASWYGEAYRGARMANGMPFDPEAFTAASWDFPLGTRVRVTSGFASVEVTITDRGPTRTLRAQGRVIDLSRAAFAELAAPGKGLLPVTVEAAP